MANLLGDDLGAFERSFAEPRSRGLRLNPAKVTIDELRELPPFAASDRALTLHPLPWCPDGYRLELTDGVGGPNLGGHPAHLAGLFYLQEPSAMAAVAALVNVDVGTGIDSVVDLAAAPGGKTTQLASLVAGAGAKGGLVVANEVVASRLGALHENLDRWGSDNVVTTGTDVADLAAVGPRFGAAVLDAPCSGEALFRRSRRAVEQWSPGAVAGAARRQEALLDQAAELVRPGGLLVYSTCTFGLAENEEQVARLVSGTDRWDVLDATALLPASDPGFAIDGAPTERSARLWPHRGPGDGQFVAVLRRRPDQPSSHAATPSPTPTRRQPGHRGSARKRSGASPAEVIEAWAAFAEVTVPALAWDEDRLVVVGDRLYLGSAEPTHRDLVARLPAVSRPGLPLGRLRPGRFEPDHALATAVDPDSVHATVTWTDNRPELAAYLRGETVSDPGPDGWTLVRYHRWGLGWARRSRNVLKNAFPRSLRRHAVATQNRQR